MMRFVRRFWWVIPVVIVVVATSFIGWAASTNPIEAEAESALVSSEQVAVTTTPWLTFTPQVNPPTTGLIFYPGGRVDPRAYAPLTRAAAEANYLAVIVPMPLNLAVFNANVANEVIAAHPEIQHWAVAGHSLGGSMAARFVYDNPGQVDGLALMASYSDRDLSDREIAVSMIYASLDALATVEQVEGNAPMLPDTTEWVKIDGGNHAQFGWYGLQDGDNEATITHEQQYEHIIDATLALLERISSS